MSDEFVSINIYNSLGQQITSFVNKAQPAGTYEISFNASGLASGVYFYRIQAGSFVQAKKMVFLK